MASSRPVLSHLHQTHTTSLPVLQLLASWLLLWKAVRHLRLSVQLTPQVLLLQPCCRTGAFQDAEGMIACVNHYVAPLCAQAPNMHVGNQTQLVQTHLCSCDASSLTQASVFMCRCCTRCAAVRWLYPAAGWGQSPVCNRQC